MDEEEPWTQPSVFTRVLPQDESKASYFKADVWHTVNLGVGRGWVASSLVILLSFFAGSSIPNKLLAMTQAYYDFCSSSVSRASNIDLEMILKSRVLRVPRQFVYELTPTASNRVFENIQKLMKPPRFPRRSSSLPKGSRRTSLAGPP